MSDPFDQAILQSASRATSGVDMELVVGEDGLTTYAFPQEDMTMGVAEAEGPQQFAGAQDQTDPFSISGPVEPMSVGEFAEKTAGVAAGTAGGTLASAVGAFGDVLGLAKGVTDMIGAEEGKRFETFLQGLSDVSSVIGSERTIKMLEEGVQALPISEEAKQDILAGSKYIGEVAGLPVGGSAAISGARRYIAGAPERLQKRGRFGTFNSGMDFQAAVDEMIVAAKKSDQPVDTSYRMEHQPSGPMDENPIRLDDLTKTIDGEAAGYPDDFYTPQGQRIYAQGPSFEGDEYGMANLESYKAIKKLRGKPNATVTIYRGVPDDPSITTINDGDFVTLSKKYAELHAASGYGRSGDEPGKVISQRVKAKDIYWDGNDVNEFGYFPEQGEAQ